MKLTSFVVDVAQASLDDLRARLARTRWPDEVDGAGWDYGASLAYMRELVEYWRTEFDWRAAERAMNTVPHFRAEVDGVGIHVIHQRGRGPAPMPLLITHGWPSSFVEMLALIPLLADPGAHGGDPADAFDVIVPSVPGFGFSDRPGRGMTRSRVAGLWAGLMEGLGYPRYAAHANDIGAVISAWLAADHPERLIALHTLMPNFPPAVIGADARPLTPAEQDFARLQERWEREEGGYNRIQETRPQTLAYGLHDSPAGLAAWIVEKWLAWTGRGGGGRPAASAAICSWPMSRSTGSPGPPTRRTGRTTSGPARPGASPHASRCPPASPSRARPSSARRGSSRSAALRTSAAGWICPAAATSSRARRRRCSPRSSARSFGRSAAPADCEIVLRREAPR